MDGCICPESHLPPGTPRQTADSLSPPITVVDLAFPKKSMSLLNQWDLEDYVKLCKTGKVAQIEMQVRFSLLSLTDKRTGKGIGVAQCDWLVCTGP